MFHVRGCFEELPAVSAHVVRFHVVVLEADGMVEVDVAWLTDVVVLGVVEVLLAGPR